MTNNPLPTHAIVAITLNCNSRCVMCDIWKNRIQNELEPGDFLRLPNSLVDINITGGEPFLRPDITDIVANIKLACPKARLVLNTNAFLPQVINKESKKLLAVDPKFAFRVSIDGQEETHDKIRRIPNGYKKIMESLAILKKNGAKDLGVSFTIMEQNYHELPAIYEFTKKENIELSLTLVTDSSIYFGKQKESLRPKNAQELHQAMQKIYQDRYKSLNVKNWFRAWFEKELYNYYLSGKRPLPCSAGSNFFYLDSVGNIFTCHLKSWLMGNLKKDTFVDIWNSPKANEHRQKVKSCNSCWMICSAKPSLYKNPLSVFKSIL